MKSDQAGVTVGSCLLQERLASGGFGTVYRAFDSHLNVERAVKVIHPHVISQKDFRDRFLAELRNRLTEFVLDLYPDKTRLIEFGRNAARSQRPMILAVPASSRVRVERVAARHTSLSIPWRHARGSFSHSSNVFEVRD